MPRPRALASVFFVALLTVATLPVNAQTAPLSTTASASVATASPEPAPHHNSTLLVAAIAAGVALVVLGIDHCSHQAGGCFSGGDCDTSALPNVDDARRGPVSIGLRIPIAIRI